MERGESGGIGGGWGRSEEREYSGDGQGCGLQSSLASKSLLEYSTEGGGGVRHGRREERKD